MEESKYLIVSQSFISVRCTVDYKFEAILALNKLYPFSNCCFWFQVCIVTSVMVQLCRDYN